MKAKAGKKFYNKFIIKKPYIFYTWLLGFVVTLVILIGQISIDEYVAVPCRCQNGVLVAEGLEGDMPFQEEEKFYFYTNRNEVVYQVITDDWSFRDRKLYVGCSLDEELQGKEGYLEVYCGSKPLIIYLLYL